MPVVNGLEIAFQITDDLCSLDRDSHQTPECCILNGERWRGAQHWGGDEKEKVEANTHCSNTHTHTHTLTYTYPGAEGGEAVMVGLHPSPAQCWQERRASHSYMHTHTHTHTHTHMCAHTVMPPNNLSSQ